jgi:hypothetical protein
MVKTWKFACPATRGDAIQARCSSEEEEFGRQTVRSWMSGDMTIPSASKSSPRRRREIDIR